MEIYLIYECDSGENYESYSIKGMSTDFHFIETQFDKLKREYVKNNPDGWFLKWGFYTQEPEIKADGSILRSFNDFESVQSPEDL